VPEEPPTGDQVLLGTDEVEGATFRVAAHVFHEGGVLQVAGAEADVTDVLGALKWRLVLLALAVGVGTGVVGWLVAGRLVRPLVHLRDTAQRIAVSQDLTTPVLVEGSGEIRDLAVSLTTMVDALASSRAEQQRLITDASHEMRTPLTSLTTNLELLRRFEELPADERPDVLATVRSEVDELTHLMEELVELVTDRSSDEPVVALDLADLAASVVARTRRRTGRAVELVLDGDGTVLARPHMIERAIANLVDNAVKYSPASTPIEVRVGPARVEVRDQGPGIAASEQDRVFERFYRADSARSVPGSGLGLAIVCQIVERHNGSVWARTGPTGGAWVGFSLDGE
jgi:two-component system sensor histidine kinase MprB